MTAPTPESAPLLEPPPPPVLAPPTTATPPPPPPEMPGRTAPPLPPIGDLLVMVGGLMIIGFSFAPFISYRAQSTRFFEGVTVNQTAWDWAAFLAPLTWFVMLGGLFLIALGLSQLLSGDRRLLGFRTSQLQILVAAYTTSILIGYALVDKSLQVNLSFLEGQLQVGSGEFAWGGVLMLVGSLLAMVGAVITLAKPQRR
jgi:hypothetical protein